MLIYKTISSLQQALSQERSNGKSIGFVPTMGALHEGHMSLVKRSKQENDCTVVSIFVNPTQFNNKEDLLNYPRMPEQDIQMLEEAEADILFIPEAEEIYTKERLPETLPSLPASLAGVMEGAFRPGHFDGVVQIVHLLFTIVQPDRAYFGEKDFQQLAIVRYMTKAFNMDIAVVGCPIYRESSGLAMSSRNLRLSAREKENAVVLSKALKFVRDHKGESDPLSLKKMATEMINSANLKTEYVEIADAETLQPLSSWKNGQNARVFVAAYCGDVRLIDNEAI
jgi:pantoate--beta-alanine ligase